MSHSWSMIKLSETQFRMTCNWSNLQMIFSLIRDSNNRTATIQLIYLKALDNSIADDTTFYVACNKSSEPSVSSILLNQEFSVAALRAGIDLYNSNTYIANYSNSGQLDLIISVDTSPIIITLRENFLSSSHASDIINLPEIYTEPVADIISASGSLTYNGTAYVNLRNTNISCTYSANSQYNTCDPSQSFIGLEFKKLGMSASIIKIFNIDDTSKTITTFIDIPIDKYNSLDNSEVSFIVRRMDDKGNIAESRHYLGYFYVFPRIMNSKIEVYSKSNEDLRYNIKSKSGTCLLLSTNDEVEFRLSYDVILGYMTYAAISITEDNQLIINEVPAEFSEDHLSIKYSLSTLKLDKSAQYSVIFTPVIDDRKNTNQNVSSRLFKLLKYIDYSYFGIDTNPLGSNEFNPKDPEIQYINSSAHSVNANTTVTVNKITNISQNELHQDIQICNVKPVVLCYNELNRVLKETVMYTGTFSNIDSASYNFNLIDNDNPYKKVLETFEISNSVNNKFFLMHQTYVRINNKDHHFYQYIARLHYVPEVFVNMPITVRSNGYSITMSVNPTNYYINHQEGIPIKYGFKMKYGSTVYYEGIVNTNEVQFPIPEQVVSGRSYTFIVNPYYSETVNGETTDYKYSSDQINFRTQINKYEITDKPDILYPMVDLENPHYCYSYYTNPYFLIYLQLPRVLEGTSGTPERGDDVYDNIKIEIGGTTLYYSDYSDFFYGSFTYLERLIFVVDTSGLNIAPANSYNIRISVRQNYGGIHQYGDPVEITVTGLKVKSGDKRIEEDYNGTIDSSTYDNVYNIMAGFCKSYAAYSTSTDPPIVIDKYHKNPGQLIKASDFNEIRDCVKRTIVDVNLWLTEIETSITELIEDDIVFNAIPRLKITKNTQNYIEDMYSWIQYIYNQIEYEPEENFITYTNYDETSCTIAMYIGHSKAVRIPPTIRGETVTAIEQIAFSNNTTLTKVIIPNTVTSINPQLNYQETDENDYIYNENSILQYTGTSTMPIVPSVLDGTEIESLEPASFSYTNVNSAFINEGIEEIK